MILTYATPDGGVVIVSAAPKKALERALGPLTDEQYRAHVIERSIPEGATDVQERSDDWQPPAARTFRDAWVSKGGKIDVDMSRARDIQRNRIRAARKTAMAILDVESARAFEDQDDAARADVSLKKQLLRDAPADPRIDAATTPEELAAIWPDGLAPR